VSKAYALIPAAGTGSRVGAALPKQYLEIAGRPLLYHALLALAQHPRIEQVFVVLAQGDDRFARYDWRKLGERIEPLYCGGETRAASVFNGLLAARDTIAGGKHRANFLDLNRFIVIANLLFDDPADFRCSDLHHSPL